MEFVIDFTWLVVIWLSALILLLLIVYDNREMIGVTVVLSARIHAFIENACVLATHSHKKCFGDSEVIISIRTCLLCH